MTLGEKLQALRVKKGYTQIEFCRAFNKKYPDTKIDRGFYSLLEGDRRYMNIPTLISLVKYYNTTADALLFDNNIPEQLKSKKTVKVKNLVT